MIDLRPYVHNALRSIPNDKLWVQIVEEFDEDAKRRLRHWLGIDDDGVVVVSSYEKVRNVTDPLLVVVLDTEDSSFGTFCTARKLKPTSKFVGTGMLIQSK